MRRPDARNGLLYRIVAVFFGGLGWKDLLRGGLRKKSLGFSILQIRGVNDV
jgi:hypothetical protein